MIRGVLLCLDQTRAALRLMMDLDPKMNEGRGMTALQLLVYEARHARRHSSEAKSFFRPIVLLNLQNSSLFLLPRPIGRMQH